MKKLTLLLLTFVASMGLFAQDNLALNKKAYASSVSDEDDTATADKAVDGNAGTKWASNYYTKGGYPDGTANTDEAHTAAKDKQWFYVDLGSEQSVNTVKITWDNQPARSFDIRYSTTAPTTSDYTTMSTCGSLALNALGGTADATDSYKFTGGTAVTARYVILVFSARATEWGYGIKELEIYNNDYSIQNLTSLRLIGSSLVPAGANALTFDTKDQYGEAITTGLTYAMDGSAVADLTNVNLSHGQHTMTVTDGRGNSKTATLYAYDDTDAPRIPTDIYIPIYTNGYTEKNSGYAPTTEWNGGAGDGTEITLGGRVAHKYSAVKCLALGNSLTVGEGAMDYDVETNKVKNLNIDILVAKDATGQFWFEGDLGKPAFGKTLTGGQWTTVTYDASEQKTLHMLAIAIDNAEENDILLSNAYFTSATPDRGDLRFRTFNIEPGSTKATLILHADYEDGEIRDVHFIITRRDNGEFVGYVSGKTGTDINFEVTSYGGADLEPDHEYGWLVATAYETNGTQGQTTKTREVLLKTIPISLKEIQVLNKGLLKQVYPKSAATQTTATWNRTEGDGGQNYRITDTDNSATTPKTVVFEKVSDTENIIDSFDAATGAATIKANATGIATFRVTASNGTKGETGYTEVTKDFSINVYETSLTVQYKTGDGGWSGEKSSDAGLARIFADNSVDAAQVTELKIVSGNLTCDDILTIRGMAGINDPKRADDAHEGTNIFDNTAGYIEDYRSTGAGKLTKLDLSGATFAGSTGTIVSLPDKRDGDGHVTAWYPWLDYCNLNDIPHYAFIGCVNLEEVTLPNNIESIGEYAFQYCDNLTTVNNTDKVKEFGGFCFMYDAKLNPMKIGDGCTNIGYSAFQGCRAMTLDAASNPNGKLPDALTFIGTYAFASTSITTITYPANAPEHLRTGVFYDCKALTTVYLPSNLKTIGYQSFEGDGALTSLVFYDAENPSYSDETKRPTRTGNTYNNVLNVVAAAFNNCQVLSDESFQGFVAKGNNGGKAVMMGWTTFSDCKLMTATTAQGLLDNFLDGSDEKGADDATVLREGEGGSNDHALPRNLFSGCTGITAAITIPKGIVAIGSECFKGIMAPYITVEADVATLGDRAFENCTATRRITFKSATAPACAQELSAVTGYNEDDEPVTTYYDPFNGITPNNITIAFDGVADYKTYRASVPFMRQMTKTVENADLKTLTSYAIAPQFGGDFKMTRTFSKGWNTLALPFGSPASGKDVNGVAKFKAAFGEANFDHISTYRGVKGSSFMFMKMDDADALNDFEPLMVKLDNAVITEITFEDVDINYKHSDNTLVAAEDMASEKVSRPQDEYSNNGRLAGLTDEFNFVGTYTVLLNASASEMTYLKEGDHIIQNNGSTTVFVECVSGKRYGLQAFRGWFQKKVGAGSKPAVMSIMDCDMAETVTEIIGVVDTETGETMAPQDIYSIDGQLVRKAATSVNGLTKGLYIMGGKKFIVK